jgi:ribA/ribD-fused uncharacterized protein
MDKIYNIKKLQRAMAEGKEFEYLPFWKNKREHSRLDRSCLSQWYHSPFKENETIFLTAEHYMMAKKAELFKDYTILEKILTSKTPIEAKKLGRKVKGFDEKIWGAKRFEIVVAGNLLKFQNPALREFLLGTKDKILVEASPVDRIWGVGLVEDDKNISNPFFWRGLNLLGFALIKVRNLIKVKHKK